MTYRHTEFIAQASERYVPRRSISSDLASEERVTTATRATGNSGSYQVTRISIKPRTSIFLKQICAWGKAHECFCGAWGFFLKDDDDAVVRILNVLGCFITGGCSGLSSADLLVCCLLVLCFTLWFHSMFVCCCCLFTSISCMLLYRFFSSSCGPLGGALYVPCPFGGSAINRSVHLAPSLSGCWDSSAGALVCKLTMLTLLSNQRGGASCAGPYDILAYFLIFLYSRQKKYKYL